LTAAVDGPALLLPEMDMRLPAFFTIVFMRFSILLPTLFFFSSVGTEGPPCAGELIVGYLPVCGASCGGAVVACFAAVPGAHKGRNGLLVIWGRGNL